MKNQDASYHPTGDHNNIQPEYGMTKYEQVLLQITCAYIAAGSNGMPSPADIMRYSKETTGMYFSTLTP